MSTLYVVATPLGNLGDITLRAVETLKAVDGIAAEDTRHTRALLTHLGISKPLYSCRSANEAPSAAGLIRLLDQGQNLAYCTDAGTPGLSDPGAVLVGAVRAAGHTVVPLPGPSAFAALLSVAGPVGKSITFEGFLPVKPGRRRSRLKELLARGEAFCVYESPFRLLKLLEELCALEPGRKMIVGREMTKIHEEFQAGTGAELLSLYKGRSTIKGEIAVLVAAQGLNVSHPADDNEGDED